jgi:cell division transport system permease protein
MSAISVSWKHIRRSPYKAIAAIFIMMQTFFVISVFTFLFVGSYITVRYYETRPQLAVFFTDEAKQEDIATLENQLKATGKVSKITFVDKKEAFNRYKKLSSDPIELELVDPSILPRSFDITTYNLGDQLDLAKQLKSSSLVSSVAFPKDAVEGFIRFSNVLRKLGATASIILAVDAILLIMLIISMKISGKKEEIEILRLLSATNWYIRWPFIYEGIFYGVIGALLGWLMASVGLLYFEPFLRSQLPPDIQLFPISFLFLLFVLGAEIIVAILLGAFSSILAALRYLK